MRTNSKAECWKAALVLPSVEKATLTLIAGHSSMPPKASSRRSVDMIVALTTADGSSKLMRRKAGATKGLIPPYDYFSLINMTRLVTL